MRRCLGTNGTSTGKRQMWRFTHADKYDVITIDPAPPLHSAGTVNLYTREFFALCKSRLTPQGVLCMWLPHAPESEMKMIMRSYYEVFPQGLLFGALEFQGFYLIGHHEIMVPLLFAAVTEELAR